ncbi:MAG: glycogen debranching enzyme N-terminal domain-containing protein [Deltaproteobacteria bacterium]|nr:glycogen debranching enzyme N-terminal domain-containing protein [Deltaproteobacteria bacterium]
MNYYQTEYEFFRGREIAIESFSRREYATMIQIAECQHADFCSLLEKEWLETNGCGGYASSTIVHCHTRKYHGLLVSNINHPGGRFVLLSKCEDSVTLQGKEFHLSLHKYPMIYYPYEGHYLNRFTLGLYPRFTFTIDDVIIEKELMLVHGENTLLLRYILTSAPCALLLTVKPFLAFRDIHTLVRKNEFVRPDISDIPNGFVISPYDAMPDLYFQTNRKSRFDPAPQWYGNFEYLKERDRGFSYQEDLFMPGMFECSLSPGDDIIFRVSLQEDRRRITNLWKKEVARRESRSKATDKIDDSEGEFKIQLHRAAGDFIIRNRKKRLSIIAGYHWFYEWGRDALISLPGLNLYANRVTEGIQILKNIADMRKNGLIPNNISERDEGGAYNSADASLWYIWCVQELLKVTGDPELIMKDFWSVMIDILSHYFFGTSYHVSVHANGLLNVGDSTTQLTWMDAKVQGVPVTPRYGCPVEINALWFNSLCFARQLAREFGRDMPFDVDHVIEKVRKAFDACLWIPDKRYLADTWMPDDNVRDESVRPNQIFSVSLPFGVIDDREKMNGIMEKVSEELLTPYGLRTLSPNDPRYRGNYAGSPDERDSAYHQGTVWPWLLGHYAEALLKTEGNRGSVKEKLRDIVANMKRHLCDAGIGQISEVFSGDPPHEPGGCIAQAWSVAEIIRLHALLNS